MSDKSESTTKGYVLDKLKEFDDYPTKQNTVVDGVIWFKEDSYKSSSKYSWLKDAFSTATKKQTRDDRGTPDYTIAKANSNVIIVVECKGNEINHSMFPSVKEYITYGFGTPEETQKYAINGALWYATFLNQNYDVVAISVSGQMSISCKVTSFVLPKGGSIADIKLLGDGFLDNTFLSISQYEHEVDIALGRFLQTEEEVKKELRRYTLACANFLRSNGIEDNSKAGFVSAIILGLTNPESKLYNDVKNAIDTKRISKSKKILSDPLGKEVVKMLKSSLYGSGGDEYDDDYVRGIWDLDQIPKGKRKALKKFYDALLAKDELLLAPKSEYKDFPDGDTVLARCIYSLYEHVIIVFENYSGIDIMGEFYTTFLRFTKGNAKEKGIVLTPKHITELFCDIAEYYSDDFSEKTKIIDICCGTGAFLIASLARIKANIYKQDISESEKKRKYAIAQSSSLIGVEKESSMFALAYANMRFHGDGKSNLFNCSSLLVDSYAPIDNVGKTYLSGKQQIPLCDALKSFGDIDVAMINPPYSLDKKEDSSLREYPIIESRKELEDKLIKAKKKLKDYKKKKNNVCEQEISDLESKIAVLTDDIAKIDERLDTEGLREVIISKGQDELDFVASMLHYIKKGGIGIAIVPMSCASSSGKALRENILKHHTLLACMTMPSQLFFDSHVGIPTCIMVFKAHIKHNEDKAVFFARWQNDGFKVVPHNGRRDMGMWNSVRDEWREQLNGTADKDDSVWLRRKIKTSDETLAEAYIETDYSKMSNSDFEKTIKKFALYKYMEENGLLEE